MPLDRDQEQEIGSHPRTVPLPAATKAEARAAAEAERVRRVDEAQQRFRAAIEQPVAEYLAATAVARTELEAAEQLARQIHADTLATLDAAGAADVRTYNPGDYVWVHGEGTGTVVTDRGVTQQGNHILDSGLTVRLDVTGATINVMHVQVVPHPVLSPEA